MLRAVRGRRISWLAAVVLLLAAAPAHAADRFVAFSGNDANPCTASQPCFTVQAAFNIALDGDRILIGPGVFVGHASTTKHVDLIGTASSGPLATILVGDDATPTVHLQGGGSAFHMRIRSGSGDALRMDSTTAA